LLGRTENALQELDSYVDILSNVWVQLARDIARQLAEERRLKEEAEAAEDLDRQQ
jgi:hypothetical protein